MMELGQTCETAADLLTGERMKQYGDPAKNYARAAAIASAILGINLNAVDVLWIMVAVKMARERTKHKADNLVDLAAYVDMIGALTDQMPSRGREAFNRFLGGED